MSDDLRKDSDPIELITSWMAEAEAKAGANYNAVSFATCDANGNPDVRFLLLKKITTRGLEVFTNRDSDKASQLRANPYGAIATYWVTLGKQVRVRGVVSELDRKRVGEYFATRSRASQLGAWGSQQSRPLKDYADLEASTKQYAEKFAEGEVPLPDHWTGYLLEPRMMEFWIEGAARLHRRLRFSRTDATVPWQSQWLYP